MKKEKMLITIGFFSCIKDIDEHKKKQKKRKFSKKWLLEMMQISHMTLLRELEANEPANFRNDLKMENHLSYEYY